MEETSITGIVPQARHALPSAFESLNQGSSPAAALPGHGLFRPGPEGTSAPVRLGSWHRAESSGQAWSLSKLTKKVTGFRNPDKYRWKEYDFSTMLEAVCALALPA
jgi:hypothetical protein